MRVEKRFHFSVKFVTWTTSTFSGVNNWTSRIWLGMSCRCAVTIWNFHFAPRGHIRVEKWRFLSYNACHLKSIYISRVDKWYFRIWMGVSCRCAITFNYFLSLESYNFRKMKFSYFAIIPPWRKVWQLISTNLIPLCQRIAKFGVNWLSGSWEEVFKDF